MVCVCSMYYPEYPGSMQNTGLGIVASNTEIINKYENIVLSNCLNHNE